MSNKQLRLTLNTRITLDGRLKNYVDFSNYSMYQLIKEDHLDTLLITRTGIKYDILKVTENLFIASMTLDNSIKYISANNKICSIILDCGNMSTYYDESSYKDSVIYNVISSFYIGEARMKQKNIIDASELNSNDVWKDFMLSICIYINKNKPSNWEEIEFNRYKPTFLDKPVKIYGGLDSNNNALVGFNLDDTYNYFTDEIGTIDTNVNKVQHKIKIKTTNGDYILDNNSNRLDMLKLCINLNIQDNKYTTYKDISFLTVDNMLIDTKTAEMKIALTQKDKYNAEIITPSGKIINCGEIIDKMNKRKFIEKQQILGENTNILKIDNITIYKKIPDTEGFGFINKNYYKHIIEIGGI